MENYYESKSILHNTSEINNSSFINAISDNASIAELENKKERDYSEKRYISQLSKRYCLLKFKSIIGNHKNKRDQKKNKLKEYTADFIYETSNLFISGGTNNEIILYSKDSSFEIKLKIPFNDWVNNKFESEEIGNKNQSNLFISKRKGLHLLQIKINKNYYPIYPIFDINLLFSLKFNKDFIFCCQNKIVEYCIYFYKRRHFEGEKILFNKYTAKGAIQINNFVLFKSNKICSMGNNNLLIYNLINYTKVFYKFKDEYSFVYSQNGLTVLPMNIKKKETNEIINKNIILCACKKYSKTQKNGIFLLMNNDENEDYIRNYENKTYTYFFDTGNFEVYCFCPILIFDSHYIIKKIITKTNYFLAGGFEKAKNKGIIKLFKTIYDYEKVEIRIEFIQDIEIIDRYNSNKIIFKKPISCIIQSSSDKNLLVTCWDGNVYSLKTLNIESYIKFDKLIENNISLKDFFNFSFLR